MNVYDQIKYSFEKLIQIDEEKKNYVMDATGIEPERLEDLIQGAEPTGMELLSICSVLDHLDERDLTVPHMPARVVAREWLKERAAHTRARVSYLSCLLQSSDCESVEELLCKYHIFMDGSILCTERMRTFLDRLLPDLERIEGAHKISIPVSVVRSVEEMAEIPFMQMPAGVENIVRIQKADQLVVRGDEQDRTTLSTFISAFSKFKPDHALVLLTSDPVLAKAVTMLNAIGIEGEDVVVLKLCADGTAALWDEPEEAEKAVEASLDRDETVRVSEEDLTTLHADSDWVHFVDEDLTMDTVQEELEEIIDEDEIATREEPEEIIVEDEIATQEELEEVIVEDGIFQMDPALLDSTMHIDNFDLEELLREEKAGEEIIEEDIAGEEIFAEAVEEEIEVDPEMVAEVMQLLQGCDEQDDENDTMEEDELKQFMSVDIETEDDEEEELSYDEDEQDLEFQDNDQLERLIREALQQSMGAVHDDPNEGILDGEDWTKL